MKKRGLLSLIFFLVSGIAVAENGLKVNPFVIVSEWVSGGVTSILMDGSSNIGELNPSASSGSYVRMLEDTSYISVSMYDVDTAKFGWCMIPSTDPKYANAKNAMNVINGKRGIYIRATYTTTSSICNSFYYEYQSYRS